MYRPRGTTLVLTLMIAALVVIAAFTLTAIGFFHLNVSSRSQAADLARNLAETTLSVATDQLLTAYKNGHQDYGTHNEGVNFTYPDDPTIGSGTLTFDQTRTDIPWSLNNLASFGPTNGSTHQVPASSVYLIAVGRAGSEKRTAEQVIYFPRYAAAMTATSTIHSAGGLVVGAVTQGSGPLGAMPTTLLPADILCNSSDASAVILGTGSHVTGSVQAVGGIDTSGAQVDGQVKAYSTSSNVPVLDISTLDTAGRPNLQVINQPTLASLPLTGFARSQGLDVTGNVTLNRGVLYVNGNLRVEGAVTGVGALIASGTLEIDGAAQLSSDNQVALVSGGDVTLGGQGQQNSSLQGMVYTNGRLYAHDMSLVGVFVANGQNGGAGAMQMDNVQLVSSPDMGRLDLAFSSTGGPSVADNQCLVDFSPSPAQLLAATQYLQSIGYSPAMPADQQAGLMATPIPPATMTPGETLWRILNARIYVNLGQPGFAYPVPPGPTHYVGPMTVDQFLQMGQTLETRGEDQLNTTAAAQWVTGSPPNPVPDIATFSLDLDQFLSPDNLARSLYYRVY